MGSLRSVRGPLDGPSKNLFSQISQSNTSCCLAGPTQRPNPMSTHPKGSLMIWKLHRPDASQVYANIEDFWRDGFQLTRKELYTLGQRQPLRPARKSTMTTALSLNTFVDSLRKLRHSANSVWFTKSLLGRAVALQWDGPCRYHGSPKVGPTKTLSCQNGPVRISMLELGRVFRPSINQENSNACEA